MRVDYPDTAEINVYGLAERLDVQAVEAGVILLLGGRLRGADRLPGNACRAPYAGLLPVELGHPHQRRVISSI